MVAECVSSRAWREISFSFGAESAIMGSMYDVVTVFGAAHLPEVQRVLLHLESHGIAYELSSLFFGLSHYTRSGLYMPQVRFKDGTVVVGIDAVLRAIANKYAAKVPPHALVPDDRQMHELVRQVELLRVRSMSTWQCLLMWARARNDHGVGYGSTCRVYLCLSVLWDRLTKPSSPVHELTSAVSTALDDLERHLLDSPTKDDESISMDELSVYASFQSLASGLSAWLSDEVQFRPALGAWLKKMNAKFPNDKDQFLPRHESPSVVKERALFLDQFGFWVGLLGAILACPLTILILLDARRRTRIAAD